MPKLKVPKSELDHLGKCLGDLGFYSKKHLLIVPKDESPKKLTFNRAQRIFHAKITEQKKARGRVRIICLKARQEGLSTYTAARFFREVHLIPYRKAMIVAHKAKASEALFAIYDRFYKNLEDGMRVETVSNTKNNYLELIHGSILTVETAGDPDAGRSQTVHRLHASEMAMWPNAEEVWTALEETVPLNGSEIIIESTAKGYGNLFHQMWEQAVSGESEFIPVFLPWWIHEEYQLPVTKREREEILATQDPYERRCLDEGFFYDQAWGGDGKVHKLTAEQIAWRRFKIRSKKGNERAFRQENPATPEEAFLATGDGFFDQDALTLLEHQAKEPLYRGHFADLPSKEGFHIQRSERGWLRVWEGPKPDRLYAIGADTSYGAQERTGFSEEEDEARSRTDFSCAWVMDVEARRMVAQLHGKIAPEAFAKQLNWLSYHYGTRASSADGGYVHPAKVGVERNHASGMTVIKKLQHELHHPNLYYSRLVAVKRSGRPTTVCGWHTSKSSRSPMLDELAEAVAAWKFDDELRLKAIVIPDANSIREMRTFIIHSTDKGEFTKAAAADGAHDDRVLALGITLQVAQSATRSAPAKLDEPQTYSGPTGLFPDYEGSYEEADPDDWAFGG